MPSVTVSKETYFRQCLLRRPSGDGFTEQTSFIPEPYCSIGRVLKLRDDDGEYVDGWVVVAAGEKTAAHVVLANERAWLRMPTAERNLPVMDCRGGGAP